MTKKETWERLVKLGVVRWEMPAEIWNLSKADMCNMDFCNADFRNADLIEANLARTQLVGADLSGADLSGADLSEADLFGANLSHVNLIGADLDRSGLACLGRLPKLEGIRIGSLTAESLEAASGGMPNGWTIKGAGPYYLVRSQPTPSELARTNAGEEQKKTEGVSAGSEREQ